MALLYESFKNDAPHLEWPCASYVNDTKKKTDLHIIMNNKELWVEVGMYADNERNKYVGDFNKLLNVINQSADNVGVLIHFEIYERGKVINIFNCLKMKHENDYEIDIKEFPAGNESGGKRAWAYRLAFCKKEKGC
jgi:hypothetical protein